MVYKNVGGKMVPVGVSQKGIDAQISDRRKKVRALAHVTPGSAEDDPNFVGHEIDKAMAYKVDVWEGNGGRWYWRRTHNGEVRSTGHQGFDTEREADEDEAFDDQMVQTGVGSCHESDPE